MIRNLQTDPYKGISTPIGKFIPTGIPTVDEAINDIVPGSIMILAGRMNGGKSTFIKQIVANAISHDVKVFMMHGEGNQEYFINSLYQCVIGNIPEYYDFVKVNKKYHKEPKKGVLKRLQKWHSDKLTLYKHDEGELIGMTELFDIIKKQIVEKKQELIIIDNLMSMINPRSAEKNEVQAEFFQRCHNIAETYSVAIVVVVHPNKEYRIGAKPSVEHISGTSDIGNKGDTILWIVREYDQGIIDSGINGSIEILKIRDYSDIQSVDVHFDKESLVLCEIADTRIKRYNFKFDNGENEILIDDSTELPFDL